MMGSREPDFDHTAKPASAIVKDEAAVGRVLSRLVSDQVSQPSERPCGRSEGDCCFRLHEAAQAFAGEREAAPLVPLVVQFVAEDPGCSANQVCTALMLRHVRTRRALMLALTLAEAEGFIGRQRVGPRLQRFWASPS